MKVFRIVTSILLLPLALIFPHTAYAQSVTYQPQDAAILSACVQNASDNGQNLRQCAGTAAIACFNEPDGFTTLGTTRCNMRENSWWDEQLNISYQELKRRLGSDLFISLRTAQRNWIAYRDASCEFRYKVFEDGTIRNILFSGCMLQTTSSRTADLMEILGWTD